VGKACGAGVVGSKEQEAPLFSSLHISACHEYTMRSSRYISTTCA